MTKRFSAGSVEGLVAVGEEAEPGMERSSRKEADAHKTLSGCWAYVLLFLYKVVWYGIQQV